MLVSNSITVPVSGSISVSFSPDVVLSTPTLLSDGITTSLAVMDSGAVVTLQVFLISCARPELTVCGLAVRWVVC